MPPKWGEILLPARETRNRARRISIDVEIKDGRKKRKYVDENGDVLLRINLRLSPPKVVVRMGAAKKGEPFESESKAIDLVSELQRDFSYHYISPFRGFDKRKINDSLYELFIKDMSSWFDGLAGNSKEKKGIKKIVEEMEALSSKRLSPVLKSVVDVIPDGMTPQYSLNPNIENDGVLDFIARRADVGFSTGHHDNLFVKSDKVGSGLRSMLELAIQAEPRRNQKTILAIEEPEAYLHPMAQRMLAKEIFSMDVSSIMISTHSPIVVEESDLKNVVIVKDQNFYPSFVSEEKMKEICSALLKKHGAEVLFSKSVLLVEGESDYFFFEILKERLLSVEGGEDLMGLHVIPVGGKQQFCPYVKLIDGFGATDHPIKWFIAADNDASGDIKDIARILNLSLGQNVRDAILGTCRAYDNGEVAEWLRGASSINKLLALDGVKIFLMPGDLEYSALEKSSETLLLGVKKLIKADSSLSKEELLKKLGSKGVDCNSSDEAIKAPYVRAFIARNISGRELSGPIKEILYQWVGPLGITKSKTEALIKKI